jgi:hypothetical protein
MCQSLCTKKRLVMSKTVSLIVCPNSLSPLSSERPSFREHHLAEIVLCSALVYAALARLHRTKILRQLGCNNLYLLVTNPRSRCGYTPAEGSRIRG